MALKYRKVWKEMDNINKLKRCGKIKK